MCVLYIMLYYVILYYIIPGLVKFPKSLHIAGGQDTCSLRIPKTINENKFSDLGG